MIAHVGGMPVEEMLPALAGTGTGLVIARAWLALRVRRRRESGT
jgi:hypothetical protein